jgi:hypothetical protein
VVAAHLTERAWAVMERMPYVVCDTDGSPVTAEEAKAIIPARWTVPEEVRQRRRSRKAGKANGATFPDPHRRRSSADRSSNLPPQVLDSRQPIAYREPVEPQTAYRVDRQTTVVFKARPG